MQPRIVDGKYEIVRELGKGGMGAVYEARHRFTRRKVALKLILAETLARKDPSDAQRRFGREARAAGSIESRHVVSVLDTGIDASTNDHYIVMELLSGRDLRELIRRRGTLAPELVLAIASQACAGLRRAHEQGIIHRDIKSGNIYLARREDGQIEVKVLDFGIAKLRVDPLASMDDHDLTRSGSVLGSPLYMSPEQATGSRDVDARSDLWSLGVVMYEALTGATPHANRALGAVILAICSEPARPLRDRAPLVPAEVAAIVHKALALEPGQRYASADAMQAAIDACLPGGAVIHERELAGADEPRPTEAAAPPGGSSDSSSTPPAQTTVDAVTYGSGAARRSAPSSSRRSRLALVGGGVVLTAVLGAWAFRARPSASDTEGAASSAVASGAAVAPSTVTPRSSVSPSRETVAPPEPTTAPARPSSAIPPSAAAAPARPARRSAPPERAAEVPAPSGRSVAVFPTAAPAPAPPPSAPKEPAIDRHFD